MRKNTTREMYQRIWDGERNKILSAIESLTGHCYLLADPCDEESPELVSDFLSALYDEGLRRYRMNLQSDDVLLKKNRALHSIIAGLRNGKRPSREFMALCYKYGRIYRYKLGKTNQ